MGLCLVNNELDCWMRVFRFANVEDARRKYIVSRVLAMFVRLIRIHTLSDEGLCCRKHITALHIPTERTSVYNVSNGVVWVSLDDIVTAPTMKRKEAYSFLQTDIL